MSLNYFIESIIIIFSILSIIIGIYTLDLLDDNDDNDDNGYCNSYISTNYEKYTKCKKIFNEKILISLYISTIIMSISILIYFCFSKLKIEI